MKERTKKHKGSRGLGSSSLNNITCFILQCLKCFF